MLLEGQGALDYSGSAGAKLLKLRGRIAFFLFSFFLFFLTLHLWCQLTALSACSFNGRDQVSQPGGPSLVSRTWTWLSKRGIVILLEIPAIKSSDSLRKLFTFGPLKMLNLYIQTRKPFSGSSLVGVFHCTSSGIPHSLNKTVFYLSCLDPNLPLPVSDAALAVATW